MRINIILILSTVILACNSQKKTIDSDPKNEVEELDLSNLEDDSTLLELPVEIELNCEFTAKDNWRDYSFEKDVKKVLAVEYFSVRRGRPEGEILVGDSLITERFNHVVELNADQKLSVKQIFQGYEAGDVYRNSCYEPRHCIYFLGDNDRIIGYLELCFACREYLTSHRDDFDFICDKQWETLKLFLQSIGMTKFYH